MGVERRDQGILCGVMSAASVCEVLDVLAAAGADAVVEGGWGVDALIDTPRRAHDDLDLLVRIDDIPWIADAVAPLGYTRVVDRMPISLVLAAPGDRRIDLHPTVVNEHGDWVQAQPFANVWANPAPTLDGSGRIGGRAVRCLTAEGQVLAHLGYAPDAGDRDDMAALVERFGVGLGLAYADGDEIAVRQANRADIAAMTDVQLRASVAAYSWAGNEAWAASVDHGTFWRIWHSRIDAPRTWTGVATIGGAIAGTVHVRPWAHDDLDPAVAAELNAAYVDPTVQRGGLGRALCDAAVRAAAVLGYSDLRLHVIEHNVEGQRFWEHLGWTRDGVDREVTGSGGMLEHRYISPGTQQGGR